jgi:hypothetical protein
MWLSPKFICAFVLSSKRAAFSGVHDHGIAYFCFHYFMHSISKEGIELSNISFSFVNFFKFVPSIPWLFHTESSLGKVGRLDCSQSYSPAADG